MDLSTIKPFVGLGILEFGTKRQNVRLFLNSDYQSFARISNGRPNIDSFDSLGLQLHYDEKDYLDGIEAFLPANPSFEEIYFLGKSCDQVLKELYSKGYQGKANDEGFDFMEIGVGIWAPENKVEAVLIVQKEYFR